MIGVESIQRYAARRAGRCVLAGASAVLAAGCGQTAWMGTVQVQFYSPEGAAVMIRGTGGESVAVVRSRGPLGDRLEWRPDDLAVFDLRPGTYGLAYTRAAGAEDAVLYGQLEVRRPKGEIAKRFCKHSFIPIKLPSVRQQEGEHRFPTRDLSYTVGLEGREFDHIKQGDLISKVYFVADLERVKHEYDIEYYREINELDRQLVVLGDRELYLDGRYQDERRRALQRSPDMNIEDRIAHQRFDRFGTEERYIKISKKRQTLLEDREALMLERRRLESERARRNALLRSLKIIHRDGALVLATPDLQLPFTDTVDQVSELGEVVAVVRVGGRHRRWAADLLATLEGAEPEIQADTPDEPEDGMAAAMQP